MEAASKSNPEDINKYFRRGSNEPDSLVNIHAFQNTTGQYDAFVEVVLDNSKVYRIGFDETSIIHNDDAKKKPVL